jgi:Flp pilus assembly protein TadD
MLHAAKRIASLVFIVVASLPAFGADRYGEWLARVSSFEGTVQSQKASAPHWQAVSIDEPYYKGDSIRTLDRSRARLQLPNETYWDLNQNSRVNLTDSSSSGSSALSVLLELWEGAALFRSRQSKSINFRTPRLSGANQGTEFLVEASDEATIVTVYDGVVDTWNEHGKLSVPKGQSAIARKGQAPEPYIRVKPQDAVQWAVYYPPIIDFDAASVRAELTPEIARSVSLYRRNDLTSALAVLDQVRVADRTVLFHNLRAGLLLTVGRVDEAELDIRRAMQLKPTDATALAQRAIVAVAKNEKDQSLALARQAEADNPDSVPAKLALSYAHQARFDLENARKSAQQASRLDPGNTLALTRLAELELSLGHLTEAEAVARKALSINSGQVGAKAMLGYAQLMRQHTDEALHTFKEAIGQNPSDPLNRFGLGLANIRNGDLEAGIRELERAASLDPKDALLRSYLGKAYYEQKRSKPAEAEYGRAKELDPKDPTPYFYEAIQKQTTNRPVEALEDMQKAIELNDNRAIFRSKQMLDDDVAARSAAVGRIYQDLNFQQRGLLEGWRSVAHGPADYSGHRLLADTYWRLPGQQIARVSELLQSQLLQPLNATPVQPSLGTRNLLQLDQSGPASPSFREFNPVFLRNGHSLQANGVVGSLDSYGDEVIQSGIFDKFSYSLGQHHFQSRGYRPNNDLQQDIYNAFFQSQITPEIGLQSELRYNDTDFGDLAQRFDPNNFDRNLRSTNRLSTARLGGTYRLSPNQTLLASFIYGKGQSQRIQRSSDPLLPDPFFFSADFEATSGELEYLGRWGWWDVVAGAGHYSEDRSTFSRLTLLPPPFPSLVQTNRQQTQHSNAYAYNHIHLPLGLTGILGVSADSYNQQNYDRQQINPKFGLIWNVTRDTTVRAAWLSTVKRPFVLDQTVEPTQVAGFNQFFDDKNGSKTTRYGFGLDHRFSRDLYAGFEFSWRQISSPNAIGSEKVQMAKASEQLHRAYTYLTPLPQLALSAEYFLQKRTERPTDVTANFHTLTTHTVPLSASYFFGNGIFARSSASFIHQIYEPVDADAAKRSDDFVLLDLALGYRLPKRLGIVSFTVKNVLDEKFSYYDTGSTNPDFPSAALLIPQRTYWAQLLINF